MRTASIGEKLTIVCKHTNVAQNICIAVFDNAEFCFYKNDYDIVILENSSVDVSGLVIFSKDDAEFIKLVF